MKARDVIKRLQAEGWIEARQAGSHRIFKHPGKPGHVTVSMHPGDIRAATLRSIFRQAGWEDER